MKRDWRHARAKIEREGGFCRRCGVYGVDAAHVIGRVHDRLAPLGWDEDLAGRWEEPYQVHEDRIVPLCRVCHDRYDRGEIDLLPVLRLDEQLQAVDDAGSLEVARRRISRPLYRHERAQSYDPEGVL